MKTFRDWILATRPWSFPASLIPMLAIPANLYWHTGFRTFRETGFDVLLAIVMMLLFQAAGNLVSDYYDHRKGVDLEGSLNGVRHIQSGIFTPREVLAFGFVLLGFAVLVGLILLWRTEWSYVWLGALAVISVVFYPWFKAHALGDLDILFCYSVLPSIGASYLVLGEVFWPVLAVCLPFGLLTVAILHINNTRDIVNDKRAGVLSFAGLLGGKASIRVYLCEILLPYLLILPFYFLGYVPIWSLLTWATLFLSWPLLRNVAGTTPGDDLSIADADRKTAKLQLVFGLVYTLSFLIASIRL